MLSKQKANQKQFIRNMRIRVLAVFAFCAAGLVAVVFADGWYENGTPGTKALNDTYQVPGLPGVPVEPLDKNIGGIMTTRHNLTQAYSQVTWSRPEGAIGSNMNPYRNDYFEVCVYCHTPHGANSTVAAPLWNRTILQNTYTLYKNRSSITDLDKTQPGPNSLTCLSCHDGATAIDSIINMPTRLNGTMRAGYSQSQETSDSDAFLGAWSGSGTNSGNTIGMSGPADPNINGTPNSPHFNMTECQTCHSDPGENVSRKYPSFSLFTIGKRYSDYKDKDTGLVIYSNLGNLDFIQNEKNGAIDNYYLGDDHPIGVKYPDRFGPGVDYREPTVKKAKIAFFDSNGNQHADPNEVRLYNTGDGYEVECGSCHDPHGVPALTNAGNVDRSRRALTPSFLRMGRLTGASGVTGTNVSANYRSELCLTCHVK